MSAAFYVFENQTVTISTGAITKKVALDAQGRFTMMGLSGNEREYLSGRLPSDEFSVTVDGVRYEGASGGWELTGVTSSERSQGELEIVVALQNEVLAVERHYIAYPNAPVIGEHTVYRSRKGGAMKITRPSIWQARLLEKDNIEFGYMPGGANFTGSWLYKTQMLEDGYQRRFDSHEKPEVVEVEGETVNDMHPVPNGTGIWHEFYTLQDKDTDEGVCLTFDYQGWWKSDMHRNDGVTALRVWCEVIDYEVAAGESFTTPNANTFLWKGDLDDIGNTIGDFIYTFKWDYNTRFFGQTTATIWREAPLTEQVFRMINYGRYIGVEQIHVDDFWFDAKGNWDAIFGDDWKHNSDFMRRNGMDFRLWMPPWHADRLSRVWLEHPDWMLNFHGNWYNWTIDMHHEEAFQWILNMLCEKQKEYGTYMLRVDGNPTCMVNDGSFTTSGGNYNHAHKQSANFYRLYKEFKEKNPGAGINGCSSGGHTVTIESVRYTDTQQTTDGWCRHYGAYYAPLFNPADKVGGGCGYGILMQNTLREDYTEEFLEQQRKACEMARWLRHTGVSHQPFVKVYRPNVLHGDKTFFMQRLTGDYKRGFVYLLGGKNPYFGKPEIVYPKGLLADELYTIDSKNGLMTCETKTGAEWMRDGISLREAKGGDTLYINLQDRPGMGTDTTPPTTPAWIRTGEETWMGHTGVAVEWGKSEDNVFVSYYQLYKNGQPLSKVSVGTYYFDISGEPGEYSVCAVDCDGNMSEICK